MTNLGDVTVNNVLTNLGNLTNSGADSTISASTLNQEATMLNQGSVVTTNMTTFAGSTTQNQGSVTVNSVLSNQGNWTNGTTNSSLNVSTLNQEATMLNQGSVVATNLTTLSGSTTQNQGSVKVNGILSNKGSWTNGGTASSLNASSLNQEATMLNQGSVVATNMTTIAGSQTENQGSVKVNNVLNNQGNWTNSSSGSSLNAASLNQQSTMLNQGSVVATHLTTFAGSNTDNQGSVAVNNILNNQGVLANSTVASTITASGFYNAAGGSFTNLGSVGTSDHRVTNIINNSGAAAFINYDTGKIYGTTILNDAEIENKFGGNIYSVDFINNNTLTNDGTVASTLNFTNASGASVTNNGTEGLGTLNVFNGTNNGDITQGVMRIATNGVFNNTDSASLNIETLLHNKGTLNTASDINIQNSSGNAKLRNEKDINVSSAQITADSLTNTNNLASVNLTNSKLAIVYQADDIQGTIKVLGSSADTSDITITGAANTFSGNLYVGNSTDKPVLNLLSGDVTKNATVSIASGSVVNVDDSSGVGSSSIAINGIDNWSGDINNISGTVEISDKSVTTGTASTTAGGTKSYYNQTGGNLKLTNAVLTMEDSSVINGNGSIFIDGSSILNSKAGIFTVSDLQNAGTVNGINGTYETYAVNGQLIAGTTGDERADFTTDLYARSNSNKKYDKYGSSTAVLTAGSASHHGIMNIADFKIYGDMYGADAPIDSEITLDNFFEYGSVNAGDTIDFTATNKTVKTAIGDYRLVSKGDGKYAFRLQSLNPLVHRGQITTLAQYQNQLAVNDMLFNHTMVNNGFKGNDYISSNPNLYASSGDMYAPYRYSAKNGGLWVKTYGTMEKLKLTSAEIDNYSYGTLIGADFGLKNLKRGWQFMPTAYMGYNGGYQKWNDTKAYQNGGQLGFLGTWYKKDFMLGLLGYGGFYFNEMNMPKGSDDTHNYFLGAATKAAYNWRIKRDFAIQPNLLFSYNHFGEQNWSSTFGQMDMQTGMLNGFNIAPGLNFIWEKETFSMYATVQYMANINDGVSGSAGNVSLPEQKVDGGYLQYGLGINKQLFSDRLSIFGQAVFRNLSRTGIGVQCGLNFKVGKASTQKATKKSEKSSKKQKKQKQKK